MQISEFKKYQQRMERLHQTQVRNPLYIGFLFCQLESTRMYAHTAPARAFLEVVDSLERAVRSFGQGGEESDKGAVESLVNDALSLLEGNGVTRIGVQVGQPMDPNLHDPVYLSADPEIAECHITALLASGYLIGGARVLRPAKVGISSGPPT